MEWRLENPREGIDDAFIMTTFGGKSLLYVKHKWMATAKSEDGYAFPSDSAAKRYYGRNYQSIKSGQEKPKWVKADFNVPDSN